MTDFGADALAAADDVLQVMYWLRGERLASAADAATIERMSGLDALRVRAALETLIRHALVARLSTGGEERFSLTEEGVREGGRRFADEFADLTRPGHGECGDPDCDCQRTGSSEDCRHRVVGE